jgi:protease-4
VLFRLLRILVRILFWPLLWLRRTRAAGKSGWVGLTLEGSLEDIQAPRPFWELRSPRGISLYALGELGRELKSDPRARGLVVTLRDARFGMATATSLREAFARIREGGQKVLVHMPYGGDTKACFVATAATEVFVGPQATLSPYGFAITTPYAHAAFERLGVVPEVLARGKYKSAGESLVRDTMSEPQKEQLGALLDGFHQALIAAIASGRGIDESRAVAIIDGAPYTGNDAVSAGLADAALYDDAVNERLEPSGKKTLVPASRYLAKRRLRLGPLGRSKVIGVIRIHGAIVQSGGAPWMRTTDERVIQAIARARKNPRVLGVVLHIDSPGGSALASDRMHHELVRLAAEKPLVACMANVAASGGYYVAAAAHSIVAEPTTLTGSIGVVAARFAVEPLLSKLGIHTEVMTRGARAGLMHPTRALSEDDRRVLQRELETIYRAFVEVVAAGRKKSFDEIDALAQGRVWSGKDARARGLVDELGGFDKALELVRTRVGSRGSSAEPAVIEAPRGLRSRAEGELARAALTLAPLSLLAGEQARALLELAFAASRENVLAWAGEALTTF